VQLLFADFINLHKGTYKPGTCQKNTSYPAGSKANNNSDFNATPPVAATWKKQA